jgi:hypothetical protein
MSLENIARAVRHHLDAATTATVEPGMRNRGSQTPAVVYEITDAEANVNMSGAHGGVWILTVEVNIYGSTTLEVLQVADDLCDYWASPAGGAPAVIKPTGYSLSMRTATVNDGLEGDERIGTLTFQLQGI